MSKMYQVDICMDEEEITILKGICSLCKQQTCQQLAQDSENGYTLLTKKDRETLQKWHSVATFVEVALKRELQPINE